MMVWEEAEEVGAAEAEEEREGMVREGGRGRRGKGGGWVKD